MRAPIKPHATFSFLIISGGDNSNDRAVQDIKVLDHREGDSPSDAAILKVKYRQDSCNKDLTAFTLESAHAKLAPHLCQYRSWP